MPAVYEALDAQGKKVFEEAYAASYGPAMDVRVPTSGLSVLSTPACSCVAVRAVQASLLLGSSGHAAEPCCAGQLSSPSSPDRCWLPMPPDASRFSPRRLPLAPCSSLHRLRCAAAHAGSLAHPHEYLSAPIQMAQS